MYHDLCVPYTSSQSDLLRTLSFLAELSYSVVAITFPLEPKSASNNNKQASRKPELPTPPPGLKPLLTRLTLPLITTSDLPNAKLHALQQTYDIVAVRPTSEKTLLLATSAPEVDLISLDLSARWPFHFRPKLFSAAVKRGVCFEICYSHAVDVAGHASGRSSGATSGDLVPAADAATARRNLLSNGTSLVRALRGGRNVIFSSEAATVLGLRAPMDVVNFGVLLGLSAEKGLEAVRDGPALVVKAARARRDGWRGVLLAVHMKEDLGTQAERELGRGVKRKQVDDAEREVSGGKSVESGLGKDAKASEASHAQTERVISKRQMKKLANKEKQESKAKGADAR